MALAFALRGSLVQGLKSMISQDHNGEPSAGDIGLRMSLFSTMPRTLEEAAHADADAARAASPEDDTSSGE